jgi:hypothetical protein
MAKGNRVSLNQIPSTAVPTSAGISYFRRPLCRETLMPLILDLEKAYADAKADPAFQAK